MRRSAFSVTNKRHGYDPSAFAAVVPSHDGWRTGQAARNAANAHHVGTQSHEPRRSGTLASINKLLDLKVKAVLQSNARYGFGCVMGCGNLYVQPVAHYVASLILKSNVCATE